MVLGFGGVLNTRRNLGWLWVVQVTDNVSRLSSTMLLHGGPVASRYATKFEGKCSLLYSVDYAREWFTHLVRKLIFAQGSR